MGGVVRGSGFLSQARLTRAPRRRVSPRIPVASPHPTPAPRSFLTGIEDDSIEGIFDAFTKVAKISKFGGGIGMHVSGVRAKGAPIRGTNGASDGIVPMLRVANNVACYVNQGSRRKGAVAIYLEPHHADVMDFLALKRQGGDEHLRARDLFYALWIPDLFMRRVEADASWSLFDPSTAPGLPDVWGPEYDALYERYEAEGRAVATVPAREVWNAALRSQIETGTPYLLFKDAANAKSNQQNLGVIRCSNLCSEILEYTGPDEVSFRGCCSPAFRPRVPGHRPPKRPTTSRR